MTWDLFSSAEAADRSRPVQRAPGTTGGAVHRSALERNEALARSVAAARLDSESPLLDRQSEWPVSAVNAAARELIEGMLPPLRVVGEVTNFVRARSGHCYFSLRDEDAQLRCVMWRDEARRLPTTPAEGMEVRALGRLTLYESRGEFQLVVSDLEGRGEGLWKLAFDRLRARLDGEGLTSPLRKRPIPRYPACVGVVTSASGAALHDILTVIRRRAPWTEVVLASCRVQGDSAAEEIAAAVRLFGLARCADVLIVGRGGGSVEDLWAFNEEVVARALAESPIPTVSAVGHETDVTIADLVADLRAPTPSAAAEAVVPDGTVLRRHLESLGRFLSDSVEERLAGARHEMEATGSELARLGERTITARSDRLRASAAHLHALSPLGALARGFAVPLDADGTILRRTADFRPGAGFDLRLVDGTVSCRVEPSTAPVHDSRRSSR